jgi:hypothetical protein
LTNRSDEDVLDDQKSATGIVADTLTGTMTTINADGTRTTVTFNDNLTDSSDAHSDDGDTQNTTVAGVTTDTPIHTIDGTAHFGWGINETIVVTDAGGNVISSGADVDSGGDDEQVQQLATESAASYSSAPYAAGVGQKTEPPGGYESPFIAGIFGFFSGLGTGGKAIVNESAKAAVQTATLGTKEIGNLIAVDPINDLGYEQSASVARFATARAMDAVTLGMSNVAYVGAAIRAIDTADAIEGAVDGLEAIVAGIADVRQNGLNRQNVFQIGFGGLGVLGGITAIAPMGKGAKGLAPKVASPGRPLGGRGPISGRTFDPANAGGSIRQLTTKKIKITNRGIDFVEKHLSRFGADSANQGMVKRLRVIASGKIAPTQADLNFYSHELRESTRYKRLGFPSGQPSAMDAAYNLWNNAHTATLEDYLLREGPGVLYHPSIIP